MAGPAVPVNRIPGADGPAADHGRSLAGTHDIWVERLFRVGLALETALGLIGEHPAAEKVHEAISELELGIRDLRDALFASQPDYPDGWPVQAHIRRMPDPTAAPGDFTATARPGKCL
jgi:hypothetical protein